MKARTSGMLVSLFAALAVAGGAAAADKGRPDPGKREYLNKCAACHGQNGKGEAAASDFLKVMPSDLTTLSKRNGGVFPFDRIYAVIDGREFVKGHGTRDMPVWGRDYQREGVEAAEHYVDMPYDMEMYARARILALIDYLNRIQAK